MDDRPRHTLKIMENQTSFDLNLAIRRWREDLARSAAFRSENLNELESHLRDSIDGLRTPQLSDEEAFLIASRRIGNAPRLEQEFGKVNGAAVWFDRCLWVLVAVQLWGLISSGSSLLLSIASPAFAWLNDILPGFGVQKTDETWLRSGLALGFTPLPMAILALLVWRYFIWPKRRGSALLQELLRRPGMFALSLFFLSVVFQIVATWALENWYYPIAFHDVYNQGLQTRLLFLRLPPMVLWAGMTYFIARKRLRSRVA
jgi:hypothetical protein